MGITISIEDAEKLVLGSEIIFDVKASFSNPGIKYILVACENTDVISATQLSQTSNFH